MVEGAFARVNGKRPMTAMDNSTEVRDGVDRETGETVQSMAGKNK